MVVIGFRFFLACCLSDLAANFIVGDREMRITPTVYCLPSSSAVMVYDGFEMCVGDRRRRIKCVRRSCDESELGAMLDEILEPPTLKLFDDDT